MLASQRIIFHYLPLGAFVACLLGAGSTRLVASSPARNVLDTLPRDRSGLITKATLEQHGFSGFVGTIEAVKLSERAIVVRSMMIFGRHLTAAEKTLTFYVTKNAQINRSGTPMTLQEIKIGEEATVTVQAAPDGKLMALSLSVGKPRGYPVAKPVRGRAGWVYSPYAPKAGPVDVSALPRGSEAQSPFGESEGSRQCGAFCPSVPAVILSAAESKDPVELP